MSQEKVEILIQPIDNHQLDELSKFAGEQFSENFAHMYEPQHLKAHLEKTCSATYFEQQLEQGDHISAAWVNGRIVAYIAYGKVTLPIESAADDMEIHRLYVHASMQGLSIGRKLMDLALKHMSVGPKRDIYLSVWSGNANAQHFYKKFGFSKVGEYEYRVGPHRDHEFIFKKRAGK